MLNLATTSQLIQVVTGAAVTSIAVHASWFDLQIAGTTVNPDDLNTIIVAMGTETVVPSPPGGYSRDVKFLSVMNTSGSPCPVAVEHFDGAKAVSLFAVTLAAGWVIQYSTDGGKFLLYDSIGNIQQATG